MTAEDKSDQFVEPQPVGAFADDSGMPKAADLPIDDRRATDEPVEPVDTTLVAAQLSRIEGQLLLVSDVLHQRLRYDEQKESMFTQLYQDLEDARKQISGDHLRPLFLDLVLLLDRAEQAVVRHPDSSLVSIAQELLEILDRQGVERIAAPDTDVLDPTVQQVIGVEDEPDDGVRLSHRVVREGYRFRDRVLRPQQVVSYRP